jgi:hypothetical protein
MKDYLYYKIFTIIFIFFAVFSISAFPREKNTNWKVIVNKINESSGNNSEYKLLIDVFNGKGEKAYSISKFIPYDMPFPATSVFNAGELMVVYSYDGTIEFYSTSGELINKIVTNLEKNVENDRVIKFQTIDERSALLISEPKLTETKLMIVSSDGNVKLKKEIKGNHATGIDFSGSGNLIAAGTYTWIDTSFSEKTTFLDSDGDLVGEVNLGFTNGMFTCDEKDFLGYTNSNLFFADIISSKLIWSYEFPSDVSVIDAVILNNEIYVLSSDLPVLKMGKWLYPNLVLNTFNASGRLTDDIKVDSEPVESARIVINDNKLHLNLDGTLISFDENN